ncbi:type 4a pilus biogenesis protein PilO [Sphaerotilus uruguayifluvii]|uniref:Type IV pilus assembly protein PilO n=1 Tax=Sphaerotilus uruguayifluvii TaxID=2735897 RepID=A0ABX2G3P0_9BURK|nr:type IV pilus assembly protein PilO [Leptothrix sp. C29]
MNIELDTLAEQVASQFRNLDPNKPGQWPLLPKLAAWLAVTAVTVGLGWFALISDASDELESARNREATLKNEYQAKLAQAINLDELRKQKLQVQEYVTQLERQLPGKAEMDALLSDINQAGLGRGLQFELFRPGQEIVRDYYAELPISLRVTGRYHDIGSFAADVANLSRIVTLHNLVISVPTPGSGQAAQAAPGAPLAMEAVARTYRYLDPAEVTERRKAQQAAARDGKGPKPAGGTP